MMRLGIGLALGAAIVLALGAALAGPRAPGGAPPVAPGRASAVAAGLPAMRGQAAATVDTAAIREAALGAVRAVSRQEFATQRAVLVLDSTAIPAAEWARLFGLVRREYELVLVGDVVGRIDHGAGGPQVAVAEDGAVTVTLAPVALAAALDLQASAITLHRSTCPDVICRGHDRLTVLQAVEPDALREMVGRAREAGLHIRAEQEAVTFYTGLLTAAGLDAEMVTVRVGQE